MSPSTEDCCRGAGAGRGSEAGREVRGRRRGPGLQAILLSTAVGDGLVLTSSTVGASSGAVREVNEGVREQDQVSVHGRRRLVLMSRDTQEMEREHIQIMMRTRIRSRTPSALAEFQK